MDTAQAADLLAESFRGLLLRHRGRTGLTQRALASRLGASRRTVQDWEAGLSHPSAEGLRALLAALLEAGGLTVGREAAEAQESWAAVLRETPRMRAPFDEAWFAGLLAAHAAPPAPVGAVPTAAAGAGAVECDQDWGEAPAVHGFVDRAEELRALRAWVLDEGCRLVAVLGIGGIGKTALAARLAQDVAPTFQRLYWRSLRDALPSGDWLAGAIGFLSDQRLVALEGEAARLAALLRLLRERPGLLVLDNFETVLEPGEREGRYRAGYEGYGRLLRAIGEGRHRSCLVLTSREAPPELAELGGGMVRTLQLGGLGVADGQVLLADKQLAGSDTDWAALVGHFGGNGLALKVVGERIREVFGGDLGAFLDEAGSQTVFGGIRRLLAEQLARSSALEQDVLRVLAVAREPVALAELLAVLGSRVGRGPLLEAVEGLRRRSLVERAEMAGAAAFTLQSVVLEYVTDRLVDEVADEIGRGEPLQLVAQPLIKAQAKEYVRQTQERLIGGPILERLNTRANGGQAQQLLLALLAGWRARSPAEHGYGPGNVVNLLRLRRGNLCNLDLAHLELRQAYLAGVDAQDASLAGANLAEAVLAEAFTFPMCVALSGDGASLVAGTSTGEVWLWRVADRTPLLTMRGHIGPVFDVALSLDGRLLASGSLDGTIRLWEAASGDLRATLHGHTGWVYGVAMSADGQLLASGSQDRTIRLWETRSGRLLAALQGHAGGIWSVALSADGRLLASGGMDRTVRLWETRSGQLLDTLQGYTAEVRSVTLSPNGQLLATGALDGTIRVWEMSFATFRADEQFAGRTADVKEADGARSGGWRLLATLQGHIHGVRSVTLSADGRLLASGSEDGTACVWEAASGRLLTTLHGHASGVWGVALGADGRLLASAGPDGTVRLWEAASGRLLAALHGRSDWVFGLALSADGQLLASGSQDGTVQLWEASSGRLLTMLYGHTNVVWSVALSADGRLLASGSEDGVRLWDTPSGQPLVTLKGHVGVVYGVALSADGRLLVGGSEDGTLRLWEAPGGRLLATLHGHTGGARGVALSADGQLVASGSEDGTVRLWEAPGGRLLATLHGHTGGVRGVALSADGQLVASGGRDGTVRLWEVPGGRLVATLEGHTRQVWGVALSADGRVLASASSDGMVQLWEVPSGRPLATLHGHNAPVYDVALAADGRLLACGGEDGTIRLWEPRAASGGALLHTLRRDRRYERLDITGLTGVTAAQRAALLALGAVERQGPASEPSAGIPHPSAP
jgi:WD40 repeat protein/transcriptional regulator with XRE-family HTH domain